MGDRPHVAASDCERIRPGWIAQPANTASSLALCVTGCLVNRRARATRSRPWRLVGAAAFAAGLGSAAYHGPGGAVGKAVHDGALGALVLATGMALAAGDTGSSWRRADAGGAALAVLAVATHATSRTGGPLCRPDSPWQGHAAWHVLIAASLVVVASGRLQGVDGMQRA